MRSFRTLALGASLLVLVSACGTGGGSPTATRAPATSAPASVAPATSAPAGTTAPATSAAATTEPSASATTEPSASATTEPSASASASVVPSTDASASVEPSASSGSPSASASGSPGALVPGTVRIGSADFYESALMAEIYAQVLEANGFTVERQLEIGPRNITFPALAGGDDFDLMPEYIGSALEYLVAQAGDPPGEASGDVEATVTALQTRLDEEGLTALGLTEAQDSNAFVVREETATELGLTSIGDLAPVAGDLAWGLPPECKTNPLCAGALETYGIDFDSLDVTELAACSGEIAQALNGEGVDVGELCSTQPDIETFGFVVLEDDQGTQPAENIAPIARNEWLESAGGADAVAAVLDPVSAAMDTETLTALNVRVGVDQEDYDVVAQEWLTENGLLPAP